ncbi:HD-GYP domain-containing protein [Pelosinus propionicus]|uniref:HDIG domain-containing protein n=1 Tax=Pelosinus propionicus DSM 13327 TaxID=1123291 RepID=A0A1I4NP12_9FIRM|nr:HD-GYP domain-containing protein [Pelosinus propionicus]SFM17268.1 HDIG domain-containing protein [Pelosinus propionicus DSM 13327]
MLQNSIIDDDIIFQYPCKTRLEITNYLLTLIHQHDVDTARHSYNVANIAVRFAKRLNLSSQMVKDISVAALLHDIGKIKIPRRILSKPEKLTNSEFEIMKRHSQYGFLILSKIRPLQHIAEAVCCHHEKINGKGYPNGKAGDEIPFIAQILSITDVYEALTTDRTYRKAMSQKEALQVINSGRETHFNSVLVNMFLLGGC